jgi:hypothetical protein
VLRPIDQRLVTVDVGRSWASLILLPRQPHVPTPILVSLRSDFTLPGRITKNTRSDGMGFRRDRRRLRPDLSCFSLNVKHQIMLDDT